MYCVYSGPSGTAKPELAQGNAGSLLRGWRGALTRGYFPLASAFRVC